MRVLLLGSTGTIGLATLEALVAQGHQVVCLVRPGRDGKVHADLVKKIQTLNGAEIRTGLIDSEADVAQLLQQAAPLDAVVSCLASRTGTPRDAWAIDYKAHSQILRWVKQAGINKFVLLSAICVQKPLLAFQQAKLAFEQELMASGLTYVIVRPTAFFKSLSGQIQRLQRGKPFMLFADGQLTACKPISDHDLGEFLALCLTDTDKFNRILPIGGPGKAITPLQQGEYLFKLLGKDAKYKHVPIKLMGLIVQVLKIASYLVPSLKDKAELARIGYYYATESMLVWDQQTQKYDENATPSFGTQSLFDHYQQVISGQVEVKLGDHSVF